MAKIGDIKSVGNGFRFRFTCPITGKIQSRKNQNQAELEKIKARLISDIDTGFYQQKVREAQAAKGKEKTTFITAVRAYEKERERDFARGDIQRSTLDTYLTQLRRLNGAGSMARYQSLDLVEMNLFGSIAKVFRDFGIPGFCRFWLGEHLHRVP